MKPRRIVIFFIFFILQPINAVFADTAYLDTPSADTPSVDTAPLGAIDFGLEISDKMITGSGLFKNSLYIYPWFKVVFGKNNSNNKSVSFFLSFELLNETKNYANRFIPRIGVSAFYIKPHQNFNIAIGRIRYADASELIANSIFDGINGELRIYPLRAALAFFYTGLLEKDQSKIIMTKTDLNDYNDVENYYAPKKIFASLKIELQDIAGYRNNVRANYILLRDINRNDFFDSHYIALCASFPLRKFFLLSINSLTGVSNNSNGSMLHHAANFELNYIPARTRVVDILALSFRWSSGPGYADSGAWTPVTFCEQGEIFEAPLTNLAFAKASYSIDYLKRVKIDAAFRWFFRTSNHVPLFDIINTGNEVSLGPEFYAAANLSPWSDISFNAGFGVFMPSKLFEGNLGTIIWKFKLGVKTTL